MKPRCYHYLIRVGYNDLDHLAPFIHRASQVPGTLHTIWLLETARNSPKTASLLNILKAPNVQVRKEYSGLWVKILLGFFSILRDLAPILSLKKILTNVMNEMLARDEVIPSRHTQDDVEVFITAHGPWVRSFIKKVKSNPKNRLVLFPHGFGLCSNELLTVDLLKRSQAQGSVPAYLADYDLTFVTEAGLHSQSSVRLSSLRFSGPWIESKLKLEPMFEWQKDAPLKVAFIDPKDSVNIFRDEFWRSCQVALGNVGCAVALINRGTETPRNLPECLRENPRFLWVPQNASSTAVIQWADIVIHCGTTLHAECILQETPVIYLRHIMCNTTHCDTYQSALVAKTRDDLFDFLSMAMEDKMTFRKKHDDATTEGKKRFAVDFFKMEEDSYPHYMANIDRLF